MSSCASCQYFSKNTYDTEEENCGHYKHSNLWDVWDIGPCPHFKYYRVPLSARPYVPTEDKSHLLEGFHSRKD